MGADHGVAGGVFRDMRKADSSPPFALSLSKGFSSLQEGKGFDKLSPNGGRMG